MPGHGIGPEISDAMKDVFSAAEVGNYVQLAFVPQIYMWI
jgi:isocitrate/isopropylmalate dehydrogenase